MGAVGSAEVIAVEPCPEFEPGDDPLVTGTFRHTANNIVDVTVVGLDEPITCTDQHPFWSEDRQEFVPASELKPEERIRTVAGSVAVIDSITPRNGPQTVYNIEVQGEHAYYVSSLGLLVHNNSAVGNTAGRAPKGGRYGDVRRGNVGGQVHHTPASAVSPYTHHTGPSVWMKTADHRRTASWGSSASAKAYRQKQADLIANGKLREAVQMDIDDLRSKFGNKYDNNIRKMLEQFGGEF